MAACDIKTVAAPAAERERESDREREREGEKERKRAKALHLNVVGAESIEIGSLIIHGNVSENRPVRDGNVIPTLSVPNDRFDWQREREQECRATRCSSRCVGRLQAKCGGLLPQHQGQNRALTVLCVPCSLSGTGRIEIGSLHTRQREREQECRATRCGSNV